jgi:Flp pilus assembly protein protease CpaA
MVSCTQQRPDHSVSCVLRDSSLHMFAFVYSVMVQYHALGVLYHIRKSDRLAVNKLVAKLTRMSLKSPYAVCMLVSIDNLHDFSSSYNN